MKVWVVKYWDASVYRHDRTVANMKESPPIYCRKHAEEFTEWAKQNDGHAKDPEMAVITRDAAEWLYDTSKTDWPLCWSPEVPETLAEMTRNKSLDNP